MTQHIRDRINRQLDALGEDRLYQVLDYIEFLESRYGQRAATPPNTFQRLADTIEDRLRAGGIAASTVSEAMGFLNKAVGALNGAVAAGKSVATDLATAAQRAGTVVVDVVNTPVPDAPPTAGPTTGPTAAPGGPGAAGTSPATGAPRDGTPPGAPGTAGGAGPVP
jgi:hypothetical protein